MSGALLQLCGVTYAYQDGRPALAEAGLTISAGERVALLGANGAGKSTLFLLLSGVLAPERGEILLHGAPVGRKEKDLQRLRRAVGLVFQNPEDQLLGTTVRAEISFGPMNLGLREAEVRAAVDGAAAAMHVDGLLDRPPQYLSGGEKKRVTIADILAMSPELVLLDEPTASLDPGHTARLEETLDDLHRRGLALLISTHDVAFAWRWADRAVVLSGGRILRDAPAAEVFADGALLERAGLRRPDVFAAAALLFPDLAPAAYPRTAAELENQYRRRNP